MRRLVHGPAVHALGPDRQDLDQDLPQVHPGGHQGEAGRHVQPILHSAFQGRSNAFSPELSIQFFKSRT